MMVLAVLCVASGFLSSGNNAVDTVIAAKPRMVYVYLNAKNCSPCIRKVFGYMEEHGFECYDSIVFLFEHDFKHNIYRSYLNQQIRSGAVKNTSSICGDSGYASVAPQFIPGAATPQILVMQGLQSEEYAYIRLFRPDQSADTVWQKILCR
jgi:hypothetical protein